MKFRRSRQRQDDSNTWIAYTDLLTTLLTFFVIISFVGAARIKSLEALTAQYQKATLFGQVIDGTSKQILRGGRVRLGDRETVTDRDGKFSFKDLDVAEGTHWRLSVEIDAYVPYSDTVELQKGYNYKTVIMFKPQDPSEGELKVEMLEGDAYFASGSAILRPEAVQTLVALGLRFRSNLKADEVIIVQGHTDDQQYRDSSKSNWELSGERAAAVCRVFQEPKYGVGISGSQLMAVGYGEFRPRAHIELNESPISADGKRSKNRRIEIRKLKGAQVFSSGRL